MLRCSCQHFQVCGVPRPGKFILERFLRVQSQWTFSRWRERLYAGCVFQVAELCIRADTITALYRREWNRPELAWNGLARLMSQPSAKDRFGGNVAVNGLPGIHAERLKRGQG